MEAVFAELFVLPTRSIRNEDVRVHVTQTVAPNDWQLFTDDNKLVVVGLLLNKPIQLSSSFRIIAVLALPMAINILTLMVSQNRRVIMLFTRYSIGTWDLAYVGSYHSSLCLNWRWIFLRHVLLAFLGMCLWLIVSGFVNAWLWMFGLSQYCVIFFAWLLHLQ